MKLKYTKEILEEAVKNSISFLGVVKYLNANTGSGGVYKHIKNKIRLYNIDTFHFTGQSHNKGKSSPKKISAENILIFRSDHQREKTYKLKRALIECGIEYICSECKLDGNWNDKPLILEIDHINRKCYDNRMENLRFLCPNCHSQMRA